MKKKKTPHPPPAKPPPPKKNSYTDSEQLQAMIEKYPALKEWVEETQSQTPFVK